MQTNSVKTLALVVGLFFFTSNLSGSFLPIYFKEAGLSISEIAEVLLFTFILIGLLPIILLQKIKNFEKTVCFGIFSTMLFYVVLIYFTNPVILGLAYGLGIATFWPSFNLLQFRLSESRNRARTVSLFSSIIPSLAGIVGPAVGGFIIENFGFTKLFAAAVILYLITFVLSTRIKFKPEVRKFSIPKTKTLTMFLMTFIILGFCESHWLAYPSFVHGISGTVLYMGIVLASSAILISVATFFVNWLSDVKKARVNFAIVGTMLNVLWYFLLSFVSTSNEIVALSLLSGLASAFSISWFAHYGDSFEREHYASILVIMEVGLMVGRIMNLAPTHIFLSGNDFAGYFRLLGVSLFFMIPFYLAFRRKGQT